MKTFFTFILLIIGLNACSDDEDQHTSFELQRASIGGIELSLSGAIAEKAPLDRSIALTFSGVVQEASMANGISVKANDQNISIELTLSSGNTVVIRPSTILASNTVYTIEVSDQLRSEGGAAATPTSVSFKTRPDDLELLSVFIEGEEVVQTLRLSNVPVDLSMTFNFSSAIDKASFEEALTITGFSALNFTPSNGDKTMIISSTTALQHLKKYYLQLSDALLGQDGEPFTGYELNFYTAVDSTPKFPEIPDEELLTKVQEQTFKYFWDFAHPVSGMTRERNTSGDVVTTGGSGFGVMAIVVGIERGFITRQQGVDRLETIVNFLTSADRFHGAWPHWMDGNTGDVIPFSQKDNGGDLVETALMIQGLLTVREYLDDADQQEAAIQEKITQLWEEVDWDWYTRGGEDVLYWHWSPDYGWEMNHQVRGWNEALIVYVLAASSPTHAINADVYHNGWAEDGDIKNGNEYYGITLPLGNGKGGPLFFAHYSFLGLDPRNLEDQYSNYWTQNVNHTLINRAYTAANPLNYVGYGIYSWGLTASDNHQGYAAHSPDNDLGVITPTAALSSMPYTPEYSMDALHHFYYLLGDKLWGQYGFYDAFNFTEQWVADSYLAIDQGPVIIMIENYRTGLLWDLFMSNTEIATGLNKLNFTSY
nr:glucoamylase family protein [Fulvivirga imtechensis]